MGTVKIKLFFLVVNFRIKVVTMATLLLMTGICISLIFILSFGESFA